MTYLIVFVCGMLTALPLIFDFLAFLPWISLIPLFLIVEKKKSAYRHGLVFHSAITESFIIGSLIYTLLTSPASQIRQVFC